MKIVIKCKPAQLYQKAFIWTDKEIETKGVLATEIADFVLSHPNADEVILKGNRNYVEHYKADIQKKELLKFGKNNLKITIEGK